ncbi:MAG: helix-turn-helix domain-containing protein [Defluviitaleaceae bacterium]|nr:helix-turn-helix domain-containing protein [Defluviitaleaceae bacterium]
MPKYNSEEIGSHIRKLREEKRLTRDAFSESANLSSNFIYDVETGRRGTSSESLFLIAHALGVTMDYLATGEEMHEGLEEIIALLRNFPQNQLPIIESTIRNLLEIRDDNK